jgi:hypothetical protein
MGAEPWDKQVVPEQVIALACAPWRQKSSCPFAARWLLGKPICLELYQKRSFLIQSFRLGANLSFSPRQGKVAKQLLLAHRLLSEIHPHHDQPQGEVEGV